MNDWSDGAVAAAKFDMRREQDDVFAAVVAVVVAALRRTFLPCIIDIMNDCAIAVIETVDSLLPIVASVVL